MKLGHVALDGTKVKANASKHKAMSYDRMGKAEAELEKEIEELLRRAEDEGSQVIVAAGVTQETKAGWEVYRLRRRECSGDSLFGV